MFRGRRRGSCQPNRWLPVQRGRARQSKNSPKPPASHLHALCLRLHRHASTRPLYPFPMESGRNPPVPLPAHEVGRVAAGQRSGTSDCFRKSLLFNPFHRFAQARLAGVWLCTVAMHKRDSLYTPRSHAWVTLPLGALRLAAAATRRPFKAICIMGVSHILGEGEAWAKREESQGLGPAGWICPSRASISQAGFPLMIGQNI